MSIPNTFRPVRGVAADGWSVAELTPGTWSLDELTPLGVPFCSKDCMTPDEVFNSKQCLRDNALGVVLFSYSYRGTVSANFYQYNYINSFSPTPVPPRLNPPYGNYGTCATPALEIHVIGKPRQIRINVTGPLKIDACYTTANDWTSYAPLTPVEDETGSYTVETPAAIKSLCLNQTHGGNVQLAVVKLEAK